MSQVICPFCGETIDGGGKFCYKCGGALLQEAPQVNAEPKEQEGPSDNIDILTYQPETEATEKKARRIHAPAGITVLSVLLCILAIIGALAAGVLFTTRQYLEPGNIKRVVKKIDLTKVEYKGDSLSEYVHDNLGRVLRDKIDEDDIGRILEMESIRVFVADKVNEYVADIISNTKKAEISEDEIEEFMDEAWEEIAETLELEQYYELISEAGMKDQLITSVCSKINYDKFSMKKIRKDEDIDKALKYVSIALSYYVIAGLAAFSVLLLVIVFVLNIRYAGGFRYVGFSALLASASFFAYFASAIILPKYLDESIKLGEPLFVTILNPFKNMGLLYGAITAGVGVVFIVTGFIARSVYKKKVKAAEAQMSIAAVN